MFALYKNIDSIHATTQHIYVITGFGFVNEIIVV